MDMNIRSKTFFRIDFVIKLSARVKRRFDRSTVIFKFSTRIKNYVYKYVIKALK